MTSTFSIKNPDAVECEIRITMSLGSWKNLKTVLAADNTSATWKLRQVIDELVSHATKQFETQKTNE